MASLWDSIRNLTEVVTPRNFVNSTSVNSTVPANVVVDEFDVDEFDDAEEEIDENVAKAPTVKKIKAITAQQGKRINIKCKVSANPPPQITWYKDGVEVKKRKGLRMKKNKKGTMSSLKISKAKKNDAGVYRCEAVNQLGSNSQEAKITVLTPETTTPQVTTQPRHPPCKDQSLCLNGGHCAYIPELKEEYCRCPKHYEGPRCESKIVIPPSTGEGKKMENQRNIIVGAMGVVSGVLLLAFIILFIMYKRRGRRQRKYATSAERAALNSYLREDDVDHTPKAGLGDIPLKTFRQELMRTTSMTQTEPVHIGPVNLEDFLPLAEPHLRIPSTQRYSVTSTGSRRPSRKRISGVSQTPGASTEELDKENNPTTGEDSSPSQSSKTESCQPMPGSKESSPGSRRRVNGVSDDDADDNVSNKSQYDNNLRSDFDEIDSPHNDLNKSLITPSVGDKKQSQTADVSIYPNNEQLAKNQQSSPLLSGMHDTRNNNVV